LTRGAHERASLAILLIAGLLTDEQHPRRTRSLAEDRLGCVLPQRAGGAGARLLAEALELFVRVAIGHERDVPARV
jgi:hypothetical protein